MVDSMAIHNLKRLGSSDFRRNFPADIKIGAEIQNLSEWKRSWRVLSSSDSKYAIDRNFRPQYSCREENRCNLKSLLSNSLFLVMDTSLSDADLLAYLDEMLPVNQSVAVEQMLRSRSDLRHRVALLSRRRDSGGHTVGEIWRRRQLSCPTRETLGTFVLGVADPDLEDYIIFHTQVIGCRVCQANLQDLQQQASSSDDVQRRKRYFESSAGLLRSQRRESS